jgi:hypothetical protein
MKKRTLTKNDFEEKFRNERIEGRKMNYLVGGDGDGSQGAPPEPLK